MIHIQKEQKLTRLVRWYANGSYEDKSPYDAVCTLSQINDDTVLIEGLCGKNITRQFKKELRDTLLEMGYINIIMMRHGIWKISNINDSHFD